MFAKERLNQITQILFTEGKLIVKELSDRFNVSEDAIRKDLKILENQGILERTYGGAILKKQMAEFVKLDERKHYNVESKKIIAAKAFEIIKNGETILLDISSINLILAEMIRDSSLEITVISNYIDILYTLAKNSNLQIISPGGILYPNVGGFVGSAAIESIEKYKVQKVFIGSCGVDLATQSVTTFNIEDGNTKKAIIKSGMEVILVMEKQKFFYDGTYRFANISEIDTIITDERPSETIVTSLEKHRVKIL